MPEKITASKAQGGGCGFLNEKCRTKNIECKR
jgi:hypothetical protein